MVKIISWNINRIEKKNKFINEMLKNNDVDIICFSETKYKNNIYKPVLDIDNTYMCKYINLCKTRKDYSGTSVYSKIKAIKDHTSSFIDHEGRVNILEFETFILVNVYTPNSGRKLNRLDYRINEWDKYFWKFVGDLKDKLNKEMIICGDLNIIPNNNFIWKNNNVNAGCTKEERESFYKNIEKYNFRLCYDAPENNQIYSYWSIYGDCREKNKGWLLDHFIVTKNINILYYESMMDILGSDHCPIYVDLNV